MWPKNKAKTINNNIEQEFRFDLYLIFYFIFYNPGRGVNLS